LFDRFERPGGKRRETAAGHGDRAGRGHAKGGFVMKRGNTLRTAAIALSLVVAGSTASFARDVCVDFFGGPVVFKKVKRLRPGGAVPLDGVWIVAQETIPVTGTAVMRSDGSVRLGLQVFSMSPDGVPGAVNTTVVIKAADETFAGTGVWENEDDTGNDAPDGAATFTSIDCATVVVP
jgi:hypothetical protein